MAEQLGAICCAEVDPTITHVVAVDVGTDKARWAVANDRFLVHPRWIEASNFRWHRQQEEDFPVKVKKKEKGKENDVAAATNGKEDDATATTVEDDDVAAATTGKEDDVAAATTGKEDDVAAATADPTDS
jgi:RNA polymerase II C-terminal domain phosphatase-like 3/4